MYSYFFLYFFYRSFVFQQNPTMITRNMTGIMWTCFLFTNFLLSVVCDIIPGHMKPLGHHRKPLGGVTIFEDFPSPTEFYENYVAKSLPFVVKGVLEKGQFPAYKLWTDKYLRYE